jgi:hypothetical protein
VTNVGGQCENGTGGPREAAPVRSEWQRLAATTAEPPRFGPPLRLADGSGSTWLAEQAERHRVYLMTMAAATVPAAPGGDAAESMALDALDSKPGVRYPIFAKSRCSRASSEVMLAVEDTRSSTGPLRPTSVFTFGMPVGILWVLV